jgi:hypothetical protein
MKKKIVVFPVTLSILTILAGASFAGVSKEGNARGIQKNKGVHSPELRKRPRLRNPPGQSLQ